MIHMRQKPLSARGNSKAGTKSKKQSWFKRAFSVRYVKPAFFALAFMIIGAVGMYAASAATTSYSLWGNSTIPRTLAVSDSSSTELGLKFRSTVAGYVTGVRFYKSAQNTGVHTGNLWDKKGNLLASVKFANETSSGWQTATFANPVSVATNVTYVISYHAPSGHYSLNKNYFVSSSHSRKSLVALSNTVEPNGVFVNNSASSVFPTQSGNGANYWVDVVFNTKLISPPVAPAAPTGVSAVAQSDNSVSLSWQASASSNTITGYTVYRDGNKLASTGTALSYADTSTRPGTTYSYQVQATDSTGATSVLSSSATVTVPSAIGGGGSGGTSGATTCPLPKYPDATCTGVPAGVVLSAYTGPSTISTANTVIDSKNITTCLEITAPGVVIKNSKITCNSGGVVVASYDGAYAGAPLLIQDSEVTCGGAQGTAIGDTNITTWRLNIHGCENGYDMDANIDIEDNYIHDLANGGADPHTDGIQFAGGHYVSATNHTSIPGSANITINHNTILSRGSDGSGTTSAIISNRGGDTNVLIQNNLLAGGAYTLYCEQNAVGVNYRVIGNHFSTIYSPKVGAYGPSTDCSDETQSGNVYHESGQALQLE
jgi:hypothetical protein